MVVLHSMLKALGSNPNTGKSPQTKQIFCCPSKKLSIPPTHTPLFILFETVYIQHSLELTEVLLSPISKC